MKTKMRSQLRLLGYDAGAVTPAVTAAVTRHDDEAVKQNQRRRGGRGGGHPAGFWGLQAGCRSDV